MNDNCAIVRDLLPLYADDVCSAASRAMVGEHIEQCPACAALLEQMKSPSVEAALREEKESVLTHERARFRRKSAVAGGIIAGILCVPLLICFIVILAQGHGADWFFVVAASLLLAASVTVVPLCMPTHKGLWTLCAFTLCLLLLLGVCAICTGGGRWFPIAASACIFGLSVVFLPFVLRSDLFDRVKHKAVWVFAIDTALLYLMFLCIGLRTHGAYYWPVTLAVSIPLVLFVWALMLLIALPRCNGWKKAGFCTALTGVFTFFVNTVVGWGLSTPLPPLIGFADAEATVFSLILLGGLVLGAIFFVLGVWRDKKRRNGQ